MRIINKSKMTPGKYSCVFASISNILNLHGYNVSESDVYFLCDGMNVIYEKGWSHVGYVSLKDLFKDTVINEFVEVQYFTDYSEESVISFLLKELSNNYYPIINAVDPNILSYNEWQVNKFDLWHCVVLYGIDVEKHCLYIVDSFFYDKFGNINFFQGEVPFIDFCKGICELVVLKPGDKKISCIDLMRSFINSIKQFLEEEDIFKRNVALREHVSDLVYSPNTTVDWKCNRIIGYLADCITPMLNYIISFINIYYSDIAQDHLINLQDLNLNYKKISLRTLKVKLSSNERVLLTIHDDILLLLDKQKNVLNDLLNEIEIYQSKYIVIE